MKQYLLAGVTMLALVAMVAAVIAGDEAEQPWFDLDNCGMCKPMASEEGLMEHMDWEHHLISNGWMTVTTVAPEYMEAFERAHTGMGAVAEKMGRGAEVHLCGFCQSYMGLAMAGANIEDVKTSAGYIGLVTSSDPAVVARIQDHAKRTMDEYQKMMEAHADQGEHDHDHGHGH